MKAKEDKRIEEEQKETGAECLHCVCAERERSSDSERVWNKVSK